MLSRRFFSALASSSRHVLLPRTAAPHRVPSASSRLLPSAAGIHGNDSTISTQSIHTTSSLNADVDWSLDKLQDNAKKAGKWFVEELNSIKSAPKAAQALGYGSLLPFVLCPASQLLTLSYIPQIAFTQVTYGACVLALAGGVRWGITLPPSSGEIGDAKAIGTALLPVAAAWGSLQISIPLALIVQGGASYFVAVTDAEVKTYPRWFMGITNSLVTVAIGSALLTLLCRFLLSSSDTRKEGQ